jgi:hypothetical protein
MKWNPGPYVLMPSGDDHRTIVNERIPELCAMPNVKGLQIRNHWAGMESSKGAYDFTEEREIYDAISACGKRLVLQVWSVRFSPTCSGIVPSYITSNAEYEGGVTLTSSNDRCIAMLWKKTVMDRFIALKEALAREFEPLPYFEGIVVSETAVGNLPSSAGYSASAFVAQLKRAIDSAASKFPTSNRILYLNFLAQGNQSLAIDLMQHMADNGIMMGGPDTFPPPLDDTLGAAIYRGEIGGVDYSRTIPAGFAVQPPEMGGTQGDFKIEEYYSHCTKTNKCSHMFWTRKQWEISVGDTKWLTDIKPAIISGSLNISKGCPAAYQNRC